MFLLVICFLILLIEAFPFRQECFKNIKFILLSICFTIAFLIIVMFGFNSTAVINSFAITVLLNTILEKFSIYKKILYFILKNLDTIFILILMVIYLFTLTF